MRHIGRFLVLSVHHLREETFMQLLSTDSTVDWPCVGGPYGETALFIYCQPENPVERPVPDDLFTVMQFARKLGFSHVLLDFNEPVRAGDDLPVYDF